MYLYIAMSGNGLFKIGKTFNVKDRIAQIRTASPVEIEILAIIEYDDNIDLEKKLHIQYSEKRVRGEWYSLTADDLISIIPSPSNELLLLLRDMKSWGFFRLGTSELLENVAKAALYRASAMNKEKLSSYFFDTQGGDE